MSAASLHACKYKRISKVDGTVIKISSTCLSKKYVFDAKLKVFSVFDAYPIKEEAILEQFFTQLCIGMTLATSEVFSKVFVAE